MSAEEPLPVCRRALALAFAASYLYRVFAALVLASPAMVALSASGIRSFPRGDARLFDPGGLYLLEVIVRSLDLLESGLVPSGALAATYGASGFKPCSSHGHHDRSGSPCHSRRESVSL